MNVLTAALGPDDVAIDVGANKGGYIGTLCWGGRRVIALEPQAELAAYLRVMARLFRLRGLKVLEVAASVRRGSSYLWVPGESGNSPLASLMKSALPAGKHRMVSVPTLPLDDLIQPSMGRIGAIKIDVEGHESAVLAGATRILKEHRPAIVCECEQRHLNEGTVSDLLHWMRGRSYDSWFVHRGKLRASGEFNPPIHQQFRRDPHRPGKDYVSNFVFLPST